MIKGNVDVTWTEEDYIDLSWFTNDVHEEKFNATVDTSTYDVGVAMCFEDLPEVFHKVKEEFDFLDKIVIAINKLETGKILPFHTDKFTSYKQRNNVSNNQPIERVIVFLHNQKAGHQLWIEDEVCIGDAGSYFGWEQNTVHMAANLGSEHRYIMQVTGIKKNNVKEPQAPQEGEMSLNSFGEVVQYQKGYWVRP
jgi:hypothetical protein